MITLSQAVEFIFTTFRFDGGEDWFAQVGSNCGTVFGITHFLLPLKMVCSGNNTYTISIGERLHSINFDS